MPLRHAIRLLDQGHSREAIDALERIVAAEPSSHAALHLLAVGELRVGLALQAVSHAAKALERRPQAVDYALTLGEAWTAAGDPARAAEAYVAASACDPRDARPRINLGVMAQARGDAEGAVGEYRAALALDPKSAHAHNNMAAALEQLGRSEEAIPHLREAVALRPQFVEARTNLAALLHRKGAVLEGLQLLFAGLADDPANANLRWSLAEALSGLTLGTVGPAERRVLVDLCNDENLSMLSLTSAVLSILMNGEPVPALMDAARRGRNPFAAPDPAADAFVRDPLLLAALPRMPVVDAGFESLLVFLRRAILEQQCGEGATSQPVHHGFLCALARHMWFAGYSQFAEREEIAAAAALASRATAALAGEVIEPRALEGLLATCALYGPLSALPGSQRLLGQPLTAWSPEFRPVAAEQVLDARRERELAAELVAITPIADEISRKVQSQYEETPYPRWVSVGRSRPVALADLARRLRPDREPPRRTGPVQVLIAGCGTGHHAIQSSSTYADAEVLAIDLSRASLAYAMRMAERFGTTNLRFRQADILQLGTLGRRFALVESVGVLHHLGDPLAGWRVLVDLLEPDGFMRIGLYSRAARASVREAAKLASDLGVPRTPEGIRSLRKAIMDLPATHPARGVMSFGDFFSLYGCRDLILNVQEHTFSIAEIERSLEQLGLEFLAMHPEPATLRSFAARFPGREAARDLRCWARLEDEIPGTFKGMYQFWCGRRR